MFRASAVLIGLIVVLTAPRAGVWGAVPFTDAPAMGWNSWDGYRLMLPEDEYIRNVNFMVDNKMASAGWEYAVVDEGWYLNMTHPNDTFIFNLDNYGRCIPSPILWPSTWNDSVSSGFTSIADQVHKQGLKFGIHVMRGINIDAVNSDAPIYGTNYTMKDIALNETCSWDPHWYAVNTSHPAAQAYYNSLVQMYADWGVDFIKLDCTYGVLDFHLDDIRAVSYAIGNVTAKTGKPILLSLSPGLNATLQLAAEIKGLANQYRIANDFWDCWQPDDGMNCNFSVGVVSQFETQSMYANLRPSPGLNGNMWPDADMLPLGTLYSGNANFTANESLVVLTAWTMWRNPLFFGGRLYELPNLAFPLLSWLTNPILSRIVKHSKTNTELWHEQNGTAAWHALDDEDATVHYLALFNLGEVVSSIQYQLNSTALGLRDCRIFDVWNNETANGTITALAVDLAPHSCVLLRVDSCWTNTAKYKRILWIVLIAIGGATALVLILFILSRVFFRSDGSSDDERRALINH